MKSQYRRFFMSRKKVELFRLMTESGEDLSGYTDVVKERMIYHRSFRYEKMAEGGNIYHSFGIRRIRFCII